MKGAITASGETRLAQFLNLGTVGNLPEHASCPAVIRDGDWSDPTPAMADALREAGFEGVQGGNAGKLRALGLGVTSSDRVDNLGEIQKKARWHQDEGYQALTLHVGHGLEDDATANALVEEVVGTAEELDFPISIETHRATITQDSRRSLDFALAHPDLRFNADFSHWYTGLEMVYGDFDQRCATLQPVFDRVTHFHGRIGTPGRIQTELVGFEDKPWVGHFRQMWTACCRGFKAAATPGQILPFAPELLWGDIHYAPIDMATGHEPGDRWADALAMCRIAQECWDAA